MKTGWLKIMLGILLLSVFLITGYAGLCAKTDSGTPSGSSGHAFTVTTNLATAVGDHDATLNGTVNPNGLSTTVYFQWGRSSLNYTYSTSVQSKGSGAADVSFFDGLTNLSANTLYNFKAVATNSGGTIYGSNQTFTTTGTNNPPVLSAIGDKVVAEGQLLTFTISGIDSDGDILIYSMTSTPSLPGAATLNSSTGVFSWTPAFDQAGNYDVTFKVTDIGDLYDDESITITVQDVPAPTCTTNAATNTTTNSATLNGSVNPNGVNVTSCIFQYGTTQSYGSTVNATPYSFASTSNVSATISSLLSGTTYNFRVSATNAGGTSTGSNTQFTTIAINADAWDAGDDNPPGQYITPNTSSSSQYHTLRSADLYDWYRIAMTSGKTYYFYTSDPSGLYAYAELFSGYSGSAGTGLVSSNGSSTANFNLPYSCPSTASYYLRVRTYTLGSNWAGYIYYYYY